MFFLTAVTRNLAIARFLCEYSGPFWGMFSKIRLDIFYFICIYFVTKCSFRSLKLKQGVHAEAPSISCLTSTQTGDWRWQDLECIANTAGSACLSLHRSSELWNSSYCQSSNWWALVSKARLNHGLPGCKPGLTNQTFLVVKPGLPDFTICAKSVVNQGIPGKPRKPGKPGYYSNQENQT